MILGCRHLDHTLLTSLSCWTDSQQLQHLGKFLYHTMPCPVLLLYHGWCVLSFLG